MKHKYAANTQQAHSKHAASMQQARIIKRKSLKGRYVPPVPLKMTPGRPHAMYIGWWWRFSIELKVNKLLALWNRLSPPPRPCILVCIIRNIISCALLGPELSMMPWKKDWYQFIYLFISLSECAESAPSPGWDSVKWGRGWAVRYVLSLYQPQNGF